MDEKIGVGVFTVWVNLRESKSAWLVEGKCRGGSQMGLDIRRRENDDVVLGGGGESWRIPPSPLCVR